MTKNKYLLIFSIVTIFIWTYLFYLEFFNYDNYVFANYHINLHRFAIIPGVIFGFWAVNYFLQIKAKLFTTILIAVFCLVSVPVGIKSIGLLLARTHHIFFGPSFVIQKSKTTVFGNDYKFIEFIKRYLHDDKNISIVLPPNELPWRHTGNIEIMNSFLYPITTTNIYDSSKYVLISSESDGADYQLWPDFKISAETIIIYDWSNDKEIIISKTDWDPNQWKDQKPWGLIIRKNI